MKKWQIALTVFVVVFVIGIFFFTRSVTTYSTRAVAVEAGATIGVAPFPDRIDFGDVPQGVGITKTLVLSNNGGNDNTIKVYILGSISQMVTVKPGKSFELEAGQTQNVNFTFRMPASAPVGKNFNGRIFILRLP